MPDIKEKIKRMILRQDSLGTCFDVFVLRIIFLPQCGLVCGIVHMAVGSTVHSLDLGPASLLQIFKSDGHRAIR